MAREKTPGLGNPEFSEVKSIHSGFSEHEVVGDRNTTPANIKVSELK